MPQIRAIFFDIGDTLVFDDPPLMDRISAAMQAAGLTLDPVRLPQAFRAAEAFAVRRYAAGIAWDAPGALRETAAFFLGALDLPPLNDTQWTAFASSFASAPVLRYVHSKAPALLTEMNRRGFVLGAISDWEDTLPEVLTQLDLIQYFRALSVSAVVGVTKPDPRLFEDAVGQVSFPPEACLHVGDWRELDVAGARAAGMPALLFDWAGRSPDADCPRVTTWDQLAAFLLALPAPSEN